MSADSGPRPPTVMEGPGEIPSIRTNGGQQLTQLDSPSGSVPTKLESATEPGPETPTGYGFNPLPNSLRSRFTYKSRKDHGGEAVLYLVEDAEGAGVVVLLKLYNGVSLNDQAMESIKAVGDRDTENGCVVRVITWGVTPDTDQSYEVQEYLDAGNLYQFISTSGVVRNGRRLIAPDSDLAWMVVDELHHAVSTLHKAGVSHQDIKPPNILVRSTSPRLDLVLADFGLSVAADRTVFMSRRMGTDAYHSPESLMAGQGGPKRDYWALGMTIAEVVAGRHPFARPDNPDSFLSDAAIRDHLWARRPIDLSGVASHRYRLLCEGLTRFNEDNRWGSEQVTDWLRGGSPDVIPDEEGPAGFGLPFGGALFAGQVITSRTELSDAMAGDWRAAAGVLNSTETRQAFLDQVAASLGSEGIEELEARWVAEKPGIDRAIADLICLLNPSSDRPIFRGFPLTERDLAPLARSVASGDEKATALVEPLYEQHGLIPLSTLRGQGQLAIIDARWHDSVESYEEIIKKRPPNSEVSGPSRPAAMVTLLAALADSEFARSIRQDRDAALVENPEARELPWFDDLCTADVTDVAALVASRSLVTPVGVSVREDRAEQEAKRQRDASEQAQARQEALRLTAKPLRGWLGGLVVFNGLVALGFGLVRANEANVYVYGLNHRVWIPSIVQLFRWSPRWPIWAGASILALVMVVALGGRLTNLRVRLGQLVAVVTTATAPFLVPIGLIYACHKRRQRLAAAPSVPRGWAIAGISLTSAVLVATVASRNGGPFTWIESHWPPSIHRWYLSHWPKGLQPTVLAQHLGTVLPIGVGLMCAGLLGIWLSYRYPVEGGVGLLLFLGIVAGIVSFVVAVPVFATALGYAALIALGVTMAVVIVLAICAAAES